MKLRFNITMLAAIVGGISIQSARSEESGPNFLLVVVDDMGWTDIGRFGGEIETLNLDQLAQSGVKFTDFHVSVSCSPTRSILLSGNDNHIAGLGNMGEFIKPGSPQFGKPGYEKGALPFDRGFQRSFAMLNGGSSHWADMRGILPADDPALSTKNGKFLDRLPAAHYSDFLMDAIRENRNNGKPFLAYLAFQAEHDPV